LYTSVTGHPLAPEAKEPEQLIAMWRYLYSVEASPTSAWAGEKGFDSVVATNRRLAGDRGNALIKLTEAEFQRWVKASENVDDDWVKDVSAKGVDGKALLEDARAMIQQYDKP
jgi:hypothetical protein